MTKRRWNFFGKNRPPRTRVLIVGAGFAGLNVAMKLSKRPQEFEITIVDKKNHHLFQPLLYQVATAGLNPADIASPVRHVLSGSKNTTVYQDEIVDIELEAGGRSGGSATGLRRRYDFDQIVLACGSENSYFGHDHWERLAPGLKSLEEATEIRRRIFSAFELAESTSEIAERQKLLTFAIVGGGPTGVELAGAIAELSRFTLASDFRNIDPSSTRVILIEGGPRLLPGFRTSLSDSAKSDLEKLGVAVWTNSMVTDVTTDGIRIGETFVASRCVIWAAGVQPSKINKIIAERGYGKLDRRGALYVESDLTLKDYPCAHALGDQVQFSWKGKALPGVAPVAIQQGRHCALNLKRQRKSQNTLNFRYFDKGQMATIGRKKAVLEAGWLRFTGFIAWVGWLVVHIYYLVGFKNKILVLFQWAYSYITYGRGARLLMERDWIDAEWMRERTPFKRTCKKKEEEGDRVGAQSSPSPG